MAHVALNSRPDIAYHAVELARQLVRPTVKLRPARSLVWAQEARTSALKKTNQSKAQQTKAKQSQHFPLVKAILRPPRQLLMLLSLLLLLHTHARSSARTHTRTHARTHAHTHTQPHAHTRTNTHAPLPPLPLLPLLLPLPSLWLLPLLLRWRHVRPRRWRSFVSGNFGNLNGVSGNFGFSVLSRSASTVRHDAEYSAPVLV